MRSIRQKIGMLLLVMGIVAGIGAAILRFQFESEYKNVEIIWDGAEVADLAYMQRKPLADVYRAFRRAGGTSISLSEFTIPQLLRQGIITRSGGDVYTFTMSVPEGFDRGAVEWISPRAFRLDISAEGLERYGVGFPVARAEEIRAAGLTVVPRPLNHPGLSENDILRKFEVLRKYFPQGLLIFDQDQVLGVGAWIRRVGDEIREGKFIYGFVEFAEQFGDHTLKSVSYPRVTRVHSISLEELDMMSLGKAFRRYKRAVRERNVRALYVHIHPWANPGEDLLATNLQMVTHLSGDLNDAGFKMGKVSVLGNFAISPLIHWIVLLGLAGGVIVLPMALHWVIAGLGGIILLGFLGIGMGNISALRWLSLVGACILPLTVFESAILLPETRRGTISGALGRATIVLALSLGSALMIASLLSHTAFLTGHSLFLGVKIAFIIPLAVVLMRVFRITDLRRFRSLLSQPLYIGTSIGIGLLAVGFLVYILRTGNFGLPLFPFEESVRVGLEETLGIRPRSREFLIGYPSLILLEWGAVTSGSFFPWLLSAAVLIPISVINTFAHLHIPIEVSILRTLYGFLVGSALGTILFVAWKFIRKS